jgi:MFS family permease
MKQRLPILIGVFTVMALSNAVVPVLPFFAVGTTLQSAIFSAYFLGAFLTVLPAGYLSDRIGQVVLIRAGLLLTLISGAIIILFPTAYPLIVARGIEGVGAGLFIAAALAWANSQKDHEELTGYFMAALNLGILVGLLGTGWLDDFLGNELAGVILFTVLAVPPLLLSSVLRDADRTGRSPVKLPGIIKNYLWLYISALVLIGVTGAVTAIYPEYTGEGASLLAVQIGAMNLATVIAVLVASRMQLPPVITIRASAILMAVAVFGCYYTPLAFPVIGALAGFIMISQLAFLAQTGEKQGTLTGLFNTATYGGFTILPFIAGVTAENAGFFSAFLVLSVIVASMAVTIGRCVCKRPE